MFQRMPPQKPEPIYFMGSNGPMHSNTVGRIVKPMIDAKSIPKSMVQSIAVFLSLLCFPKLPSFLLLGTPATKTIPRSTKTTTRPPKPTKTKEKTKQKRKKQCLGRTLNKTTRKRAKRSLFQVFALMFDFSLSFLKAR